MLFSNDLQPLVYTLLIILVPGQLSPLPACARSRCAHPTTTITTTTTITNLFLYVRYDCHSGNLMISDTRNHRIEVVNKRGNPIFVIRMFVILHACLFVCFICLFVRVHGATVYVCVYVFMCWCVWVHVFMF